MRNDPVSISWRYFVPSPETKSKSVVGEGMDGYVWSFSQQPLTFVRQQLGRGSSVKATYCEVPLTVLHVFAHVSRRVAEQGLMTVYMEVNSNGFCFERNRAFFSCFLAFLHCLGILSG